MVTYVPILRETAYERDAICATGGLSAFEEHEPDVKITPLIEAVGFEWEAVVDNISGSIGQPSFVDVPRYLEEEYSVDSEVDGLLSGFTDRFDFFTSNRDRIDIPVTSSSAQNPNYNGILLETEALLEEFDTVAPRIILRSAQFSETAAENLSELSEVLRGDEILFVDFYDIGVESGSKDNFKRISSIFQDQDIVALNVYDTGSRPARNYGPTFTDIHSIAGFGDFLGGPRFVYPSQSSGVTARHYFFDDFEVRQYSGNGPESALQKLRETPEWDGKHCKDCKALDRMDDPTVSRLGHHRTGHYIHSIREDTYKKMSELEPNEYDPEGADRLR